MSETAADDDIAYVRRLAESGAHAPLRGGRFLAWWGLLLTIAYLAHYFALRQHPSGNGLVFGIIWMSFGVVGWGGQMLLARSMRAAPGGGSAGNRASRVVWGAGAGAILAMVAGSAIAAQGKAGPAAMDWIVPLAFACYACALIVTGSLARDRTAILAGWGAIFLVGLSAALIASPWRYLLAAAGVALTVLLPGLLLMLRERKA
ncbi:MAG: hypothetical protein QOH04_1075 [Sphingomonadales bacterium]|jgi:hypothetical protein|nr:hypothetical protein [Sphingomonadales bacterium]